MGDDATVESAILLCVPEAEPVVGRWRDQGDSAAALGIPAHVTLLYPFAPDPGPGIVAELRRLFAGVAAFDLTFSRVDSFGDEVLYLAPDQAEECRRLTLALARRWPDWPPYGGQFPDITPHLTLIDHPDRELHARARRAVEAGLPIRSSATHGCLYVRQADGRWSSRASFPLAPGLRTP